VLSVRTYGGASFFILAAFILTNETCHLEDFMVNECSNRCSSGGVSTGLLLNIHQSKLT